MRAYFQYFRKLLWLALLLSAGFATYAWFRPYSWKSDPAARAKIEGVAITRDRSNFWLEVHVKITPGLTHDLQKPILLVTSSGKSLEPADITFSGIDEKGTTDIWPKFWLEPDDIAGAISLKINDGTLTIKANPGTPGLSDSAAKYFVSENW